MPKVKKISLDFILLFILGTTNLFIIYHEVPVAISVIFSNLFFIAVFLYLLLDLLMIDSRKKYFYKIIIVLAIVLILIISYQFLLIIARQQAGSHLYVHDNILQIEEGIKYLLQGKNPYQENYFNTPLVNWSDGKFTVFAERFSKPITINNPALYHYISLPFYTLFSVPFYLIFKNILGWYDQRFVHLFVWLLTLITISQIPKKSYNKLLLLILFALNPIFSHELIIGSNDVFLIFWLIATLYLLKKDKIFLSSITYTLACTSKHSAWFLAPFYLYYIYLTLKPFARDSFHNLALVFRKIYPLFIIGLIIILPFILWNFKAFWEDIYHYPAGTLETSFPIKDLGFSMLLVYIGIIKSQLDYFPFWILQLIFGLPILILLLKWQRDNNSLSQVFVSYGALLLVFWFFSRFFNINYIAFLSIIFTTSFFIND
jgi:hypothetical protein